MTHYSTKHINKNIQKFHVWLITQYGEVLLYPLPKGSEIFVQDVTIVVNSLEELYDSISKKWGIKISNKKLKEIYTFISDEIVREVCGFVYQEILDSDERKSILELTSGAFVDYHNLEDIFKIYKRDNDFNESYYTLLAYLDKRYGFKG